MVSNVISAKHPNLAAGASFTQWYKLQQRWGERMEDIVQPVYMVKYAHFVMIELQEHVTWQLFIEAEWRIFVSVRYPSLV